MKIKNLIITFVSAIALLLSASVASFAKVVGDKIVLGAAVSLTGKYSSNGVHTQNGYNMAVDRINSMGGIKVGGKTYKFDIIYYDDESNPKRAAQLAERLISQDKVEFMLGPYSSGLTKAMAPVTEKYGVPMVEANGASRSPYTGTGDVGCRARGIGIRCLHAGDRSRETTRNDGRISGSYNETIGRERASYAQK